MLFCLTLHKNMFSQETIPQMPIAEARLWCILSFRVWGHYWRPYSPKWEKASSFCFSYKCFQFL